MNIVDKSEQTNNFLLWVLYPAHIVVALVVILYPIYFDYDWKHLIYLFCGWILLPGLGSAVTLHRIVSHRTIVPRHWIKIPLLWLASMCLQGSPLGWAAIHRGSHHRYSDTERDAHSPVKGIWYSYHGWLHDWNRYFNPKYSIDLLTDKTHLWFAHNYTKLIFVSWFIIGLISWELLIFTFLIPAVYSLHQESIVNVMCHTVNKGYRNFNTKDNSNNRPLLGYLFWGQAWHNNHHYRASSYDLGTGISGKKLEFDPCLIFLPLITDKSNRTKVLEGRKNAMANSSS